MPGPAPDPRSLREARRERAGVIRTLPKSRPGAAPAWPLSKATEREREVWRDLWKRPQAIVWAENSSQFEVAMHVRTLVEAEQPGASASLRALVLRQAASLLLTDRALLAAGYRISNLEPTSSPVGGASIEARRRNIPSSRGRLRALNSTPDRPPLPGPTFEQDEETRHAD